MKKQRKVKRFIAMVLALLMCLSGIPLTELNVQAEDAQTTYTQVTSLEDVKAGGEFVLVAQNGESYYAADTSIEKKLSPKDVTVSDGTITGTDIPTWTVAASGDGVSFSNGATYLGYSDKTNFKGVTEAYTWNVSDSSGTFRFTASGDDTRSIAYGTASNQLKFGAYSNNNTSGYIFDLMIFKEADSSDNEGDSGAGNEGEQSSIETLTPSAVYEGTLTGGTSVDFQCKDAEGNVLDNVTFEISTDQSTWNEIPNSYTIPEGEVGEYILYVRGSLAGKYSQTLTLTYTIESSEPETPVATAEKVSSLTQLDKVYIYSVSAREVMTATANGKKLAGTAATVSEDKLTVTENMAELIVAVDNNGYYSFLTEDGKYLTSGATGNSLNFADGASDYSIWTLEDAGDGSFYIKNVNAKYGTTVQAMEYYYGFTTYGAKETEIYKFQFFKSGTAEALPDVEEPELPESPKEDEITDGDYVIWAPAYNKALSSTYSGYYNKGVEVTEDSGKLSGYGNTEIWAITKNEDNTYDISYGGQNLAMADSYSSLTLGEKNDKWILEDAGNGLYYVKNTVRECYIEWYAEKSNWSGYKSINSGSEGMFALKFSPVEKAAEGYETEKSIVENIAQWGGGGPYDDVTNATVVYGDRYIAGDQKDINAKFTIKANGSDGKPFQQSTSTTTGGTNYYMGGENIGKSEGDYMQFAVNTAGYGDMTLSFRLRATKAAPGSFQLQYSTDNGNTFQNFTTGEYSYAYTQYTSDGSYPVTGEGSITDGIAKTSLAPTYYISFSFDVPEGADNAENLLIRLTAGKERASGDGPISGNIRIDSVVLSGSPIVDESITGFVTVTPDGEEEQPAGTELTMTSATAGAEISYRFVDTETGKGDWITYDEEAKPVLPDALPATLEAKAVSTGKADSIVRIFTYAAGSVENVKMTPNGGGVYIEEDNAEVTLSCATEGAKIYYKLDDAEEYTEYTGPISLSKGFVKTVIKAYAVKEGFKDSAIVTRTFTERTSGTYNLYFGQLHSHTSYSDGAGTADEAFAHASKVDNLDFLAVTDHSNSFDNEGSASISDGSMSAEWKEGHKLADQYTTEDFVGLFGYEMTWSNGLGHINTFNTLGFQSRTQAEYKTYSTALQNYYETLKTESESISQFNHPGTTFGDFSDFAHYDEEIDDLITIIEVGNGEGAIGSSGYFPSYEYYTRALDKGWHVAPTNNQDNHKGLWGDANTGRSVVLADSLTQDAIYDAMRNYRVYATEDNDLQITYTLDDNIMGAILGKSDVEDTVELKVVLNDPTDDVIGKVEVIVNGGLSIANDTVDGSSDTVTFNVPADYSYYYIKVTEADGDIAVTAPVWVGEIEAVGISGFTTDAALPVQNEELNLTLDLYNNEKTELEIDKIEFTIDDKVIHTVDLTKAGLTKVNKMGTATYTFPYTYDGLGKTEIYATVTANLGGVQKIYKEKLELSYASQEMVTRVIIDGTHYNDYVTGYYGDNMNNFTSIAAESQVEVTVATDEITKEMLEDCSLLVISAPAKKSGTANAGAYEAAQFEDRFIEMVKEYVEAGGNVIVCGLADYQDKNASNAEYHTAAQINKLLTAIGSTLKINDDEAYDEKNNGGQAYRIYPENFNAESEWTEGIAEGQTYSQYSGCTVDISGNKNDIVGEIEWIVKGFDTTYSIDSDHDGIGGISQGDAVFLACQDTVYGGTIFAAGGVFLSDFEVEAELDNIWDLPYANRTIAENILNAVKVELPLSTIKEMRAGKMKDVFRIQGYATSGRIEGNAFFDAMYIQDETGGITVFPIGEDGLELGTKMEIIGYLDQYQGDLEIQIISYKILDEEKKIIEPEKMSNKDAMDYENHGGKLIQVQGEVVEVEFAADGKGVSQFVVKDANGDLAKVFIDGYILSSKTGENTLASIVKKGNTVSAAGLLYLHPEGDSDESVAVLRVRDCEEVILVKAAAGTGSNGNHASSGNSNASSGTSGSTETDNVNSGTGGSAATNESTATAGGSTGANTGDSSNVIVWVAIMLGVAVTTVVIAKKKKQHE